MCVGFFVIFFFNRNRKTATCIVETGKWQPLKYRHTEFGFKTTKKYQIHDEYEICNPGDIVMFRYTDKPFSKMKKHGLVEVIRAAPLWEDYPSWEGTTEGDFHLTHSTDPDRDDIESHTQRLMKSAKEQKLRKGIFKQNENIKNKDNINRQQSMRINDNKLNSWKDQVSKWGV